MKVHTQPIRQLAFLIIVLLSYPSQANEKDAVTLQYLEHVKQHMFRQKDSTQHYLQLTKASIDDTTSPEVVAMYYKIAGICFDFQTDYHTSRLFYDSALQVFQEVGDKMGEANILNNLGLQFERTGQYEDAINSYLESLSMYQELGDSIKIGRTLVNLGNTYYRVEAFDKARKKFREALAIFDGRNTKMELGQVYSSLGSVFREKFQYDSAIYSFNKALRYLQAVKSERGLAIVYNNLGNVYHEQGEYKAALQSFEKSQEIKQKNGDTRGYIATLRNMADTKRLMNDISGALEDAEEGYEGAVAINDAALKRDLTSGLAEIHHQMGNHQEAVTYYQSFIQLNDSLLNIDRTAAIASLEAKYNDERKERALSELTLANSQKESERNLFLMVAVLFALIILFVWYRAALQKRSNKTLAVKNEIIQKALSEKEILIKEVHHRVKNNLQTVSSLLNLQASYLDEEAKKAVAEGRSRVKSMALIHQRLYRSDDLKGIRFSEYLEQLTESLFQTYKVDHDQVSLQMDVAPMSLDVDTAIPLGLIINELVTNSLKYAFPKGRSGEICISLQEEEDKLNLEVSDNGVGMIEAQPSGKLTSFGTRLITSLANRLEAKIENNFTNGTSIKLVMNNYALSHELY